MRYFFPGPVILPNIYPANLLLFVPDADPLFCLRLELLIPYDCNPRHKNLIYRMDIHPLIILLLGNLNRRDIFFVLVASSMIRQVFLTIGFSVHQIRLVYAILQYVWVMKLICVGLGQLLCFRSIYPINLTCVELGQLLCFRSSDLSNNFLRV